jgi:phosphopantetheine adenylyltransferase
MSNVAIYPGTFDPITFWSYRCNKEISETI